MPAVNPLLAVVAPSETSAKASRPGYVLQDMMAAKATQATASKADSQVSGNSDEPGEKSFASILEAGMEKGQDRRQAARMAQEESATRAAADRKEDAAARDESGSALPLEGAVLPLTESVAEAPVAFDLAAQHAVGQSETSSVAKTQSIPTITPAPVIATGSARQPARVAELALLTLLQQTATAAPAQSPLSGDAQPAAASRPLLPGISLQSSVMQASVPLTPDASALQETGLFLLQTSAPLSEAANGLQSLFKDSQAIQNAELQGASAQVTATSVAGTDPMAALPADSEVTASADLPQGLAEQQALVAQEQSAEQATVALAEGVDKSALHEVTPGQGDLAERMRAWRGLSVQDGAALQSLFSRSEAAGSSLFVQASGQLQQFADSLRLAVNQADTPALLSTPERGTSASTPATSAAASSGLTAGVSAGVTLSAALTADTGSAWRADNLQLPSLTGTARASAGTLQFMQTMQPSSFGAPLGETFGQNAWAESVTQRVALMTGLKLSSARIELDPPELGAMTVKVSVSGDQASVSFASPHASVRDALEQSFPRLQEMLGQQGLQLADAQVSDQSAGRQNSGDSSRGSSANAGATDDDGVQFTSLQSVKVATSLIDYYA